MAKTKKSKEILENPDLLAEKIEGVEHWIERNPKIIFTSIGVVAILVASYFGFQYWKSSQENLAQKEMFQAVRYFESDSLNLALEGDGNNLGFKQIIEDYPWTDASNLANFYSGTIFLRQEKFSSAIESLKNFKSKDELFQARAYCMIGDAYMEEGKFEDAASYYKKATDYKPNKYFTPNYLMKLALALEKSNQKEKALNAYKRIVDDFWDCSEIAKAKKYKARLESN